MTQDPTALAKYFEGADFPATGGELAGVAAGNGAPDDVIEALREYEGEHFDDASTVIEKLGKK